MPTVQKNTLAPQAVVDDVQINLASLRATVDEMVARAERGQGFTLFTLNLDHLVKRKASATFRAAYQAADLVTADGWPIVWLAQRKGVKLERTCGSDLVEPLCAAAAKRGFGVYFVGPGPVALPRALAVLQDRNPGLTIAGSEAPDVPRDVAAYDIAALAARINASEAKFVFLSLGAPKQELVAGLLAPLCPGVGFLCVGAALDFIAGAVQRAPKWVQAAKMEWAWRLASDPRRLAWRYALCAQAFLQVALAEGSGQRAAVAS